MTNAAARIARVAAIGAARHGARERILLARVYVARRTWYNERMTTTTNEPRIRYAICLDALAEIVPDDAPNPYLDVSDIPDARIVAAFHRCCERADVAAYDVRVTDHAARDYAFSAFDVHLTFDMTPRDAAAYARAYDCDDLDRA